MKWIKIGYVGKKNGTELFVGPEKSEVPKLEPLHTPVKPSIYY